MNWQRKKLGEICEEIEKKKAPVGTTPYIEIGNIDVSNKKVILTEKGAVNGSVFAPENSILISRVRPTRGAVVLLDKKMAVSSAFTIIKPKSNYNPKLLFYFLAWNKKFFDYLGEKQKGTNYPSVREDEILEFEVAVPENNEIQKKIVRILDTVYEAVEVQEKIIEKTKELKKSLMDLLFHYGLAGLRIKELSGLRVDELTSSEIKKFGLKFKKTEIGEIPEHWEVVRLGEVCELRKEQVIPNPKEKYVGLEHLDTGESRIRRYGLGSEVKSLKSKFYPKDILYGKLRPYLDKVAVAEFEGLCSTDLLVIAADEDRVLPNYLVELMHTSGFLSFAIGTMSGTNHPRTSWDSLRIFKILLPPLSEQKEIAEISQTIDQKIEIEKKKKELYQELFKTLLNKIMKQEIDM